MKQRGKVKPMKAGSFRDSVAKTVRMLTRDQVEVSFRGFQPCVVTRGDKVVKMILPELNDNASPELIEAMQGFLDHECGHIFFTPFGRAAAGLKGLTKGQAKMRHSFANIIEDIRLEKLLPRELPGTKDNLERMYEAVMDKFFGKPIQDAIAKGANPEMMMGRCIVVGFRALAGQKAFQKYMDDNNLWQWLTPLTSRLPTLSKDLSTMETYADVERIVTMVLDAMEPKLREQVEEAMEQDDDQPSPSCTGSDDGDPQDDDESDSGDAGDNEGNSSEGDEADEGDGGDADDDSPDQDTAGGDKGDPSDKDSEDSDDEGEGHGDGDGTDDGSDEDGGDCGSDEPGGDDDGVGDSQGDEEDQDEGDPENTGESDGKSHQKITDALKQLEPTQRKVLYLHKNRKRSVTRIAEKLNMTEDAVKATLRDARRALADIYMGSA